MQTHAQRDDLIVQHQDFVRRVVAQTIRSLGLPGDQADDYRAAGFLGLVEAAHRYDKRGEVPFERFAYLRVRGAIIDYIRETSYLSGVAYRRARALHALEDSEANAAAKTVTKNGDESGLEKLLNFAAGAALAYRLSAPASDAVLDTLTDDGDDPETALARRQVLSSLKTLIKELPEKERYIVEGYYFRERSFAELIEERPEFSKSWVSRLHSRALERLAVLMQERQRDVD